MMHYLRDAVLIIGVSASLIATADAFTSLGSGSGGRLDGRPGQAPDVVEAWGHNPRPSIAAEPVVR